MLGVVQASPSSSVDELTEVELGDLPALCREIQRVCHCHVKHSLE